MKIAAYDLEEKWKQAKAGLLNSEPLSIDDCWDAIKASDFMVCSRDFRDDVSDVIYAEFSEMIRSRDYSLLIRECQGCGRERYIWNKEIGDHEMCNSCRGAGWVWKDKEDL